MKRRTMKTVALALCMSIVFSIASCSAEERDRGDDSDTLPTAAQRPTETTTTPTTDATDTTDDTDATGTTDVSVTISATPAGSSGGMVAISPDLTYPDHVPEYSEVHPDHAPGDIKGQEASDLLDEIEHDMIVHGVTDYFDATILFKHPEDYDIDVDNVTWGDLDGDPDEENAFYQDIADKLYSIDYEDLDFQDKVFYDRILFDVEETLYALQYTAFAYYEASLNPLTSFQCNLLFLLEVMTFETVEEADKYIELVADTARYMDQMCTFEEERAEYGFALTADTYEDIAKTFDDLVEQTDTCFLYDSFEDRLDNISGLSDADRADLISRHEDAMKNSFFPSMQTCADRMRGLKSYNAESHGLCDYPGGDAYYAYIVRTEANKFCDPAEMFDVAFAGGKGLMTEMSNIIATGNVNFNEYTHPPYSMGDMRQNLDYLFDAIKDDFPELHDHSYFTMDVPEEFEESFSPAAFLGYHLDTYDSNMIITNNSGVNDTFGITCAHEGYPGHMFDSVYHREHDEHPYMYVFETVGYAEGWATYVEGYAHKYFGTDEGARRLNQIDDEFNLYFGTIMDLGIHVLGWDAHDCADQLSDIVGYTISASGLEYIVNLLLSDPGYYTKYGLGFIFTEQVMEQLHNDYPDATDMEIHTAYLDAQEGTFDQVYEHASELLG